MNSCLLHNKTTQKLTLRDRVINTLKTDNTIPSFSAAAQRLIRTLNRQDTDIGSVAEIVELDPGLTAQFLKLASSPAFGVQEIRNIREAVMVVGLNEARKIATTLLVMDNLRQFRVKVNWDLFWLHCLLTARMTEHLADAYREVDGREYLAGLLHDVGKLFLEHYFIQEFELIILRASLTRLGMYEAEMQLLDLSHAEVSSLLCEKWKLNPEVIRSIRWHHDPFSEKNTDPANKDDPTFLANCICLADKVANLCHANIQGTENLDEVVLESLPEWTRLKQRTPRKTLIMDMASELQISEDIINATKVAAKPGRAAPVS